MSLVGELVQGGPAGGDRRRESRVTVMYPGFVKQDETDGANEAKESFGIRNLPWTKTATIVHKGSYRKVGSLYERIEEWIKHGGFEVCGPAEEAYLSVFGISSEEQTMEIRLPVQ